MICIQCTLEALDRGEAPPNFNETPEAHMTRVHPHGVDPEKRRELERRLFDKIKGKAKEKK